MFPLDLVGISTGYVKNPQSILTSTLNDKDIAISYLFFVLLRYTFLFIEKIWSCHLVNDCLSPQY